MPDIRDWKEIDADWLTAALRDGGVRPEEEPGQHERLARHLTCIRNLLTCD